MIRGSSIRRRSWTNSVVALAIITESLSCILVCESTQLLLISEVAISATMKKRARGRQDLTATRMQPSRESAFVPMAMIRAPAVMRTLLSRLEGNSSTTTCRAPRQRTRYSCDQELHELDDPSVVRFGYIAP